MKAHPNREALTALAAENAALVDQVAAARADDATAMKMLLGRVLTQHSALLAITTSMAADLYPAGYPEQPK